MMYMLPFALVYPSLISAAVYSAGIYPVCVFVFYLFTFPLYLCLEKSDYVIFLAPRFPLVSLKRKEKKTMHKRKRKNNKIEKIK